VRGLKDKGGKQFAHLGRPVPVVDLATIRRRPHSWAVGVRLARHSECNPSPAVGAGGGADEGGNEVHDSQIEWAFLTYDPDEVCDQCGQPIRPGQAVGHVGCKMIHAKCFKGSSEAKKGD
jgi:hypothetical protein